MNTSKSKVKVQKLKSGDHLSTKRSNGRVSTKHLNDDIPVKRRDSSLALADSGKKRNPAVAEIEREREKKLKKKKGSTALMIPKLKKDNLPARLEKPATKTISKLTPGKMKSILGDSAEEINQLLESDSHESAQSLLLKRLAQATLDMLPYAEHAIRKTKGARGVYQYNSLITSIRELVIDMQSTRDKGALGDAMVEKIIRPVFLDIGMLLVQEDRLVETTIRSVTTAEAAKHIQQARQESLVRISQAIQSKFADVKRDAISFLQQ